MNSKKAFSLVEILIVVCILGILAAIVVPQFSHSSTKAKEAAAKEMLQTLRTQIELYSVQHNESPPGYLNGEYFIPLGALAERQLTEPTNTAGMPNNINNNDYPFGPYLNSIPKNPFNESDTIYAIPNNLSFPDEKIANFGWLFQAITKRIRLNTFGTDSQGVEYQEY